MAISTTDQALLSDANNHSFDLYVNAWPLRVVATALVNQTTFTAPIISLTVDTTSSGWTTLPRVGMMVRVTDPSTGALKLAGVIRKSVPTSTSLLIDAKSTGDAGEAVRIATTLANNDVVTIYDTYPLWSLYSVIRSKIFYKDYDLAYTNQGTFPAPVANIGAWRWAKVASASDTVDLVFDSSASYGWVSGSLTRLWTIPSGATLVSGTTSSASITVRFPPGFYLIECTVTQNGVGRRAVRPIWVNTDTGTNAPLSAGKIIQISSDRQTLQGRDMSMTLYGGVTQTEVPNGGAVMVSEVARYDGYALTDGVGVDRYVGMIANSTYTGDADLTTLSLDLRSPAGIMRDIGCVPQVVEEKASPSKWTEVITNAATPSFVIWYLIHYHCPNALLLFDYFRLSDTTRKTKYSTSSSTMETQVKEIADMVGANFGSASDGRFYLLRDPRKENTTFRNAMENRMTLTEDHLIEQIERGVNYRPTVGRYTLYGFTISGTKVAAVGSTGGKQAQGQGSNKTQGPSMILANQSDADEKAVDLQAMENNPTPELTFKMFRNFDIFDPPRDWNKWYSADIAPEYDPRGEGFEGRVIAQAVDREWRAADSGETLKYVTVTLATESQGASDPNNKEIIKTNQVTKPPTYRPPSLYVPNIQFPPPTPELVFRDSVALFGNSTTYRTTSTFTTPGGADGPTWGTKTLTGVLGTIIQYCLDWSSPLYQPPAYTGSVTMYVVTSSGVYRIVDPLATATNTLVRSFSTSTVLRTIAFSPLTNQHIVVISNYRGASPFGTWCDYSTDGGSTWNAVQITAHYNTTTSGLLNAANLLPSLWISEHAVGRVFAGAFTATGAGTAATSTLYRSDDYGATWSPDVTMMTSSLTTGGQIWFPRQNNDNDRTMYWTKPLTSTTLTMARTRAGVQTNINPATPDAATAGPITAINGLIYPLAVHPLNSNLILTAASKGGGATLNRALYLSETGGQTWERLTADSASVGARWNNVYWDRLNQDVFYVLGESGRISVSNDRGFSLDDRKGNIVTSDEFLFIIGG